MQLEVDKLTQIWKNERSRIEIESLINTNLKNREFHFLEINFFRFFLEIEIESLISAEETIVLCCFMLKKLHFYLILTVLKCDYTSWHHNHNVINSIFTYIRVSVSSQPSAVTSWDIPCSLLNTFISISTQIAQPRG